MHECSCCAACIALRKAQEEQARIDAEARAGRSS